MQNISDKKASRFWARVTLSEFVQLFETDQRKLIKPHEFIETLDWATHECAAAILENGLLEEAKHNELRSERDFYRSVR